MQVERQPKHGFAIDYRRHLLQTQGVVLDSPRCLDRADPVLPAQHRHL